MKSQLESIQEAYEYSIALESFVVRDETKRGKTRPFVSAEAAMKLAREYAGKDKKGRDVKPSIEHFKSAIKHLTDNNK